MGPLPSGLYEAVFDVHLATTKFDAALQVMGAFYSLVEPTPTGTNPQLVAFSPEVAADIGLDPAEAQRPEFAAVMSGNAPMSNAQR